MKKVIKKIIMNICYFLGILLKPFYRLFLCGKKCIVKIEGGLSSQMEQYVLGQTLKTLGYDVWYDTTTYIDGKSLDVAGKDARNFDLNKLDNSIKLNIPRKTELKIYKYLFPLKNDKKRIERVSSECRLKTPAYLGGYGYPLYTEEIFEKVFSESIHVKYDKELFGSKNEKKLEEILSHKESIGLHVRRGDTLLPQVGRPIAKKEYYLKALSFFNDNIKVYIFSDDAEWVTNELIPYVPNSERCEYVNINDSSAGWCDMVLLSSCSYQIKSPSGGLGRDAYRINHNPNKKLVLPVFLEGNMSHMKGNIIEIILDDKLCDLSNVRKFDIRL